MIKSLLTGAMLLVSACASAELKSVDFLSRGDGLITHDTLSGLYWLDLPFTSTGPAANPELSYLSVQQKTQSIGNPLFGFTHATIEQVNELFTNAGLAVSDGGTYHKDGFLAAKRFLSMTGVTDVTVGRSRQLGYTSTNCSQAVAYSFKQCYSLSGYAQRHIISSVGIRDKTTFDAYAYLALKATDVNNSTETKTGHYLVTHYNPTLIREVQN